uniref:Uncharacterized protein n=1 Tax=Arundo donax TaxID=35708 RepID=A0A0A9BG73_ARUDO
MPLLQIITDSETCFLQTQHFLFRPIPN